MIDGLRKQTDGDHLMVLREKLEGGDETDGSRIQKTSLLKLSIVLYPLLPVVRDGLYYTPPPPRKK